MARYLRPFIINRFVLLAFLAFLDDVTMYECATCLDAKDITPNRLKRSEGFKPGDDLKMAKKSGTRIVQSDSRFLKDCLKRILYIQFRRKSFLPVLEELFFQVVQLSRPSCRVQGVRKWQPCTMSTHYTKMSLTNNLFARPKRTHESRMSTDGSSK